MRQKEWEDLTMSTKFSRKTFLKGSVAGLGMMALNVIRLLELLMVCSALRRLVAGIT